MWRECFKMATRSGEPLQSLGDEKPCKIAKVEEENDAEGQSISMQSLENVKLVKVLWNDVMSKTVFIHGKVSNSEGKEEDAVIKLEKTPFDDNRVNEFLGMSTKLDLSFQNDIYSQYNATADPKLNTLQAVTIVPATQKHILKYSKQKFYVVNETPQDFAEITLPHIKENQHSLQWVYNILEHKAESSCIIYEDENSETGFLLLPDLKWNEKQLTDLYISAIVVKRGINSLRSLTKEHVPLLKNIRDKGLAAIQKKYGVNPNQLRVFFHYYPTYYHLHVHFVSVSFVSATIAIGKAHFLDDVIDNIENVHEDFYAKKTIPVLLGDRDPLLRKFIAAGRIQESETAD